MADDDYQKKLRDLQKYVPFLENTIKRLKTETGKPREAQITKLQSLLVILTDTKKKLKYDALKKCEEVVFKLYEKVEKKPTADVMHKYMCRNPPEDKFPTEMSNPTPSMDNEVALSVARQKLSKQTDLTPASPSPPLENLDAAPTPVVIPMEKLPTGIEPFYPQNEFNTPYTPFHNEYMDNTWIQHNPQTINWPSTVFQPLPVENMVHPVQQQYFQPQNQQWPPPEPLYSRRIDVNPHDPKYNVWNVENRNFPSSNIQREVVDYSDNFVVTNSPKITDLPKPVPVPKIATVLPKNLPEISSKVEAKPKELIKITFPPKIEPKPIAPKPIAPLVTPLTKPPLSESDLQDLISSSTSSPKSGGDSPLVNEDMDLKTLEELKAKLCKELEKSKKEEKKASKPVSSTVSQPVKPKSPRIIERVKEQDNFFGSTLSSIDEQIMGKNKTDKKEVKKDLKKNDLRLHLINKDKNDKSRDKCDKVKEKKVEVKSTITKPESSINKVEKKDIKTKEEPKKDSFKPKSDDAKKEDHKKDDKESSKSKDDQKHKSKDNKHDLKLKDPKSDPHKPIHKSKTHKEKDKLKEDAKNKEMEKDDKGRRPSISKEPKKTDDIKLAGDIKEKTADIKQKVEDKQKNVNKQKVEENKQKIMDDKQKTVDSKQKLGENKQKTADSKQKVEDKQKTADSKQKVEDKQKTVDSKQKVEDKQKTVDSKPKVEDKQKTVDSKQKVEDKQKTVDSKPKVEDKQKTVDSKPKVEDKQKTVDGKEKVEDKQKTVDGKEKVEDKQKTADSKQKVEDKQKTADSKQKVEDKQKTVDTKQKVEDKQKTVDTKQKVEDKQKTVDSKQKLTEDKQKNVEVKHKIEDKQKTVDSKQKITDAKQKTVDSKQKIEVTKQQRTVVIKHKTVDSKQKTEDSKQKLAENKQKTIDSKQKVDDKQKTVDVKQKVDEKQKNEESRKVEIKQKTMAAKQKPDDSQQKIEDKQKDETKQKPEIPKQNSEVSKQKLDAKQKFEDHDIEESDIEEEEIQRIVFMKHKKVTETKNIENSCKDNKQKDEENVEVPKELLQKVEEILEKVVIPKQIAEYQKHDKQTTDSESAAPIIDNIMKKLKESVKERQVENLCKFGDSVREMQENLLKSDSNHSLSSDTSSKDEKVPNSGRLSDKYPHKRKLSIEKLDIPEVPKLAPKKPLTTEIHPLKLSDPRLKNNPILAKNIPAENTRPEFQPNEINFPFNRLNQFSYQNDCVQSMDPIMPGNRKEPLLQIPLNMNRPPSIEPFQPGNMNRAPSIEPFQPGNHQNMPNMNRMPSIEPFAPGNMQNINCAPSMEPFAPGNIQNMDPYSNNMGNMNQFCNNMDEFGNNMDEFGNNMDQFGNNMDQFGNPVDQFESMNAPNPFNSNFDVDMRDQRYPTNYNNQMNHVNQNSEQFWNRSNQDQFINRSNQFENNDFHNQRFGNFGNNRFGNHNMNQNRNFQDSNFSQYDLSQMNPIDFYDKDDKNQERRPQNTENEFNLQNNRTFRGRGINRGTFRGRGRNIQWVNPIIREDKTDRARYENRFEDKDPRRSRFEDKHEHRARYSEEKDPRDSRTRFSEDKDSRSRFSEDKDPRSRFSEDKDPRLRFSEDKRSRFSSDDRNEEGRKYSRFTSQNDDTKREDPRKHKRDETDISKDSKDSKEKKKEEIFSPLDSLYSKETKQIGKGYGFQKFKIPKIRRSVDENKEDSTVKKEADKPVESTEVIKIEDREKVEEISDNNVDLVVEEKPQTEEPKNTEEISKIEENKVEQPEEIKNEASTSKEESTNEITLKAEPDDKLEMFNKFMKHIFDTCDSSVLLQYLDKCGFALPQAKTKRIRRIIQSDSESDEDEHKEEEQKEEKVEEPTEIVEPELKTPEIPSKVEEIPDEVVETVGERIKNRRRKQLIYSSDSSPEKPLIINENSPSKTPPKKGKTAKKVARTRRKNALELLQDDLREMFISKGVLTATGKRMCRMMKEHEEKGLYCEIDSPKKKPDPSVATTTDDDDELPLARRKPQKNPKKLSKLEEKPPLRKTRSSPRVVLEKINFPTKDSETSESEPETTQEPEFVEPEPEVIKPTRRTRRFGSTEPVLMELNKFGAPKFVKTSRNGRKKQVAKETDDDSESIVSEKSEIETETTETEIDKVEKQPLKKKTGRKTGKTKKNASEEVSETETEPDEKQPEKKKPGKTVKNKKIIEDNDAISENSQKEEAETIETETSEKKKPPIKKKKKNWAHGVIKKQQKCRPTKEKSSSSVSTETSDRLSISESFTEEIEENLEDNEPTSQLSDPEENNLLKIDVLPDVNYFQDKAEKVDCKLCDFKGKNMVHHYKTRHIESEVMISRLSPEEAEKAITESQTNKFEEIIAVDELFREKKLRTTYTCRFCAISIKNELAGLFFDHVCCHTGEYRYTCEMCPFKAGNKKTMSAHCHNSHTGMKKPLVLTPDWEIPNFRIVFGYLCKSCNFVQLLKQNVEKHIQISHPKEDIDIIKINMSNKSVNLDDLTTQNDPEEMEEAQETTAEVKAEEKTSESVKEPNMTVFLESEDNSLREQKIQDERRKKMEEISSNITPRRSTLQFVDQLKNKLQNALSNSNIDPDTSIDIEEHPLDLICDEKIEEIEENPLEETALDETPLEESPPENCCPEDFPPEVISSEITPEETIPKELSIKIASTCSLAGLDTSETETEKSEHISDEEIEETMDISNVESLLPTDSKQKGVLDTIQRLAAKLQGPVVATDSPIDEENEDIDEQIINVGAIEARIKKTEQFYSCLIPNCGFNSNYKISFTKHCSDNHNGILVPCQICQKDNITLKNFTMTSLFVHLFDKHKNNAKYEPEPPKIRLRRISGDILSKPNVNEIETTENEISPLLEALSQPIIFQPDDQPIEIVEKTIETAEKTIETIVKPVETIEKPLEIIEKTQPTLGFIQIKDVRTLTPEEEHNLQPNKLPAVTTVTTVTSTTTTMGKKLLQTKKILIPVSELPKFLQVKRKPKELCSVQKTGTIFEKEILTCNKTRKIFNEMMRYPKIMDLYKCPIELCSFSINDKFVFAAHFTSHRWCQITSCVYCLEDVSSSNLITHIYKYHHHCTFQCGFCFYRAVNKNYVLIHQQTAHGFTYESLSPKNYNGTPKYYIVPTDIAKVSPIQDFVVHTRQNLIQPYLCRQSACNLNFLIADDFMVHLHVNHKKNFECALCQGKNVYFMTAHLLIAHYLQHFIGKFQCRFCLFATANMAGVFQHYARKHPAMKPVCYFRQFKNKNNPHNTVDDIIEIDMETKIVFDKSLLPTVSAVNSPDILPVCSSPTVTTTVTSTEQLDSTSNDTKTNITNVATVKDPIQIPKSNNIIDVIDLSDDNPQIGGNDPKMGETDELSEPLVTLKHRSLESKNAVENAVDPLSFDTPDSNIETNFSEIVIPTDKNEQPLENAVLPTCTTEKSLETGSENDTTDILEPNVKDLTGKELFKCGSTDCNFSSVKISDFKIHLITCDIMSDNVGYNCYHCKENFMTVTDLCEHIQIHGIQRFSCGICFFKSALSISLVQHMKDKHNTAYTRFHPVDPLRKDILTDKFYVKPIRKDSNETLPTSPQKLPITTFGPEDIDLLPRPPVYSSEIKCKLCNYATKVRSNMQRHLQQHIEEKTVPETAPVNPVPCLEKNEKMFDKMTNLAASSHYGRMGGKTGEKTDKNAKEDDKNFPGFIPVSKRFVCGAKSCNYLTHGDTMLRHHLTALHSDETTYKCPHCNIDIPCEIELEIDQILFHLKMHDLHLYKCPECEFIHYQKHKIERHFSELHPNSDKNIIIVRELDNSANQDDSRPSLPKSFAENTEEFKPWRCGFCSFKTTNRPDIQNHASLVHNIKSQFKCGLCNYRCSAKNNYSAHYKRSHPNEEINIVSVFYKTSEEETPKTSSQSDTEAPSFDTTPLWVKNKSGVKHIRGILLEETKTSPKRTPKIIEKLSEIKNSLGEGTSKNVDGITKHLFDDEPTEKNTKKTTKTLEKSLDCTPKFPSNYGTPEENLYVCPTCEKFKTKSVKDFIGHLHEEMNYYRCVCNLCDVRFVDISQAKLHWTENHGTEGSQEEITPLTPDGKVENWVDNCVRYQHKKMKKPAEFDDTVFENLINISPSKNVSVEPDLEVDVVGSDEEAKVPRTPKKLLNREKTPEPDKTESCVESPSKLCCQHCGWKAKTSQTLRKHIKRHFTNLPVHCNHCNSEFMSATSVVQHHRAKHKNLEVSYTETSVPELPSFRPLKRKRVQNDDSPVPAKIFAKSDIKTEIIDTDAENDEMSLDSTVSIEKVSKKRLEGPNTPEKSLDATVSGEKDPKRLLTTSEKSVESTVSSEKVLKKRLEGPEPEKSLDATVSSENTKQLEGKDLEKSEFDIIYVCFHCPRKSDDLETVRLHFIGSHEKILKGIFKYKKVTVDKNKKTQYKCNYCSFVGHPDGLKQHHLDNHKNETWVCQKAVKFRCNNCLEIFGKINPLRKHFHQFHPKKNFCYQTVFEDNENDCLDTTEIIEEPLDIKPVIKLIKCEYCFDCFETSDQLLSHHNLLHSHLELKIETELKKYKCPQCYHTSNSYPAMRDHLRSHNKPFSCSYCPLYFSYPNQLKSHHLKEHRHLPLKEIKEEPEIRKQMDKLRESMLYLGPDGQYSTKKPTLKRSHAENSAVSAAEPPKKIYVVENPNSDNISGVKAQKINVARKSTSLPAICKNVAKKSTANRPKTSGFSFYGSKPVDINAYKNVMSEINIMGKTMPINVVAMSHVLNLFPKVVVTDFKKQNSLDL